MYTVQKPFQILKQKTKQTADETEELGKVIGELDGKNAIHWSYSGFN